MMKIDFVFLLKAIKENRNITIYKKKKDTAETLRFFSRFFKVHSREDSIIIDLPYVDGYTHKRLEPGDSISVLFHEAGFRFQFETQVQETTGIGAFGKTQIPALKIAWPLEIVDGNRRSLFRASVYLGEAVGVNYFIQRENQPDAPAYEGVEALMIDISENGTAVKINRRINIQIGNRLKITFRLEEEDRRELLLEGTVRHIRQYPGSDVHICGIAFSPQNSPRYKRVLQEITCYTMSLNQENVNFFTVNQIVSSNPYVRKIVDHEVTEEVLDMLLKKKLPLTPEEYLECLAYVMDIEKFKTRATVLLKTLSVSLKESYIQRMDANHKVVYCILGEAIEESHFRILAGIINNGYLPVEFLTKIALKGTPRMLRLLLANKIKLIAFPEIIDIMEENPRANNSVKAKIEDLKNIYLKSRDAEQIPTEDVIDHVAQFTPEEWIDEDENEVYMLTDAEEVDTMTRKALNILHRVNRMPMHQRIKLAISGTKAERIVLAKDPSQFVVMAVLESPKVTKEEVVRLAQSNKTPKDVVIKICGNRMWTGNYSIIKALLKNPQIPIVKAPGFVKKLKKPDLEELLTDATAHPVVINLARYFYQKRK